MTTPGSARCSSTPHAPTAGARVRRGFAFCAGYREVTEVCRAWIAEERCWSTPALCIGLPGRLQRWAFSCNPTQPAAGPDMKVKRGYGSSAVLSNHL